MRKFGLYTLAISALWLLIFYSVPILTNFMEVSPSTGLWFLAVFILSGLGFVLWPLVNRRHLKSGDDYLADQFVDQEVKEDVYGKRIAAVLCAGIVFLIFRSAAFQVTNITGSGMEPNYTAGTYVYVAKFAYGYGQVSIPLSPLQFKGRFLGSEPLRGDVVQYRNPKTDSDHIARVIGLGGERIQIKQGTVFINDTPARTAISSADANKRSDLKGTLKTETLPNNVSFDVLDTIPNGIYDNTNVFTVPPGAIFLLGDNRDNSIDSRVLGMVGFIPAEYIVGRVETGRHDPGR